MPTLEAGNPNGSIGSPTKLPPSDTTMGIYVWAKTPPESYVSIKSATVEISGTDGYYKKLALTVTEYGVETGSPIFSCSGNWVVPPRASRRGVLYTFKWAAVNANGQIGTLTTYAELPALYGYLTINVYVKFTDGRPVQGATVRFQNFTSPGVRSDISKTTDASGLASATILGPPLDTTVVSQIWVEYVTYGFSTPVSGSATSTVTRTISDVPVALAPTIEYTLTITATVGGTTNPAPGQYKYVQGSTASVTAILPQQDYIFDHWNLDGINVGVSNPISVTMNTNHSLEAVFTYSPAGPPPVAPPVAPPPEEVAPPPLFPPITFPPITLPTITLPTTEIIPGMPALPVIIPLPPGAPPIPIEPETAGLIVLGAVVIIIVIGAAVWYFTKPS